MAKIIYIITSEICENGDYETVTKIEYTTIKKKRALKVFKDYESFCEEENVKNSKWVYNYCLYACNGFNLKLLKSKTNKQ